MVVAIGVFCGIFIMFQDYSTSEVISSIDKLG